MTAKSESKTIPGYIVTITGRHMHVTDAMKTYALEKLSKVEKFSPRTVEASITMDISRFQHHVAVVLKFDHIKIKAEATTGNMYDSVDVAFSRIEQQLLKYKSRLQKHHTESCASIDMRVNIIRREQDDETFDAYEANQQIEAENRRRLEEQFKPHSIVSQETLPLKTLSYDDAIMKMELSQDHFMVFRNEIDNTIQVIYRRHDGNYGVIETQ